MAFLTSPLDAALSSTSKIRLLRLLIEQDRTVSGREASRLTGMSVTAIQAAIEDLAKLELITREISGRQFLCRANREHMLVADVLTPLFAAEARWPGQVFEAIRGLVSRAAQRAHKSVNKRGNHFELLAAWIYGSVARGTDEPGSDVDIMFLAGNDYTSSILSTEIGMELGTLITRFGADVRPVVLTRSHAKHQLESHDRFVMSAFRDVRVIIGEIPEEFRIGKSSTVKASR